eukprot:3566554-Pleurochrysis_carterae.AAC.9
MAKQRGLTKRALRGRTAGGALRDHPKERDFGLRVVDVLEKGADAVDEALDPVGMIASAETCSMSTSRNFISCSTTAPPHEGTCRRAHTLARGGVGATRSRTTAKKSTGRNTTTPLPPP